MESFLQKLFPRIFGYSAGSYISRIRQRRLQQLSAYLQGVASESNSVIRILDVGGSFMFWRQCAFFQPEQYHITLLNLEIETLPSGLDGFESVTGDACRLPENTGEYDVVFSNSVIEHLSPADQQKMAAEICGKAKRYIVQTPNFWFPFEPHSQIPCFQFLPHWLRAMMIRWGGAINWFPKKESLRECLEVSRSINMLSKSEFRALFPDAKIVVERLWWLPKSFMAIAGFDEV